MTVNGSETMTIRNIENLGHKVDRRHKGVRSINTGEYWSSMKACAETLKVKGNAVSLCCTRKGTCNGRKLRREEDVHTVITESATELQQRIAECEELKRKAALWDAQEAEKEAVRKAEEDLNNAIAKAEATVERRQRIYDRKMDDVKRSFVRLEEAKRELAELKAKKNEK